MSQSADTADADADVDADADEDVDVVLDSLFVFHVLSPFLMNNAKSI